jgi:TRAP-type mannitol/chloroaromatic compound transport system substrate-binding protein
VRRREFLRGGAAGALAAPALAAPAIAQTAPEIKWRLASSYPKSLEVMYGSAQTLCRYYVAEATDSRFLIQPYAAGELAQSQQALDAVASGAVECAYTPLYFYASRDPVLGLGSGLPFGLNARQQLSWWTFGGGRDLIGEALRKFNALGLPAGSTGAQMGAWFKKEITSLDDLKGLRFRLARLGVHPLKLGHADVFAALENGTIDAAEFISPHDDEKLGLVRVAKHNHYPCWWESGGMVHMVVNLDRWNALPKSFQAIVARACEAVNGWMLAKYDAVNPPALKRLIAAGAVIKPFPSAVMEAFHKATSDHHAELAAKDAGFRRALESANGFRKEQLAWWQIAEHAYDGMVLASRGRA